MIHRTRFALVILGIFLVAGQEVFPIITQSYSDYQGDDVLASKISSHSSSIVPSLVSSKNINQPVPRSDDLSKIFEQSLTETAVNSSNYPYDFTARIGGSDIDTITSMVTDDEGNIYIAGYTGSESIFNVSTGVSYNAPNGFVAKLTPSGNEIIYLTFLGGGGADYIVSIQVDEQGNVYAGGITWSYDFPTLNPFQSTLRGECDWFVTKINFSGNGILYSTYLGGNSFDSLKELVLDMNGNLYISGYTYSDDFPVFNANQGSNAGGKDGVIVKMNATDFSLSFSTYYGGSSTDDLLGIAIDNDGFIYVTGATYSYDLPMINPYDSSRSGSSDGFIAKFSPAGDLINSTYLGGSDYESITSITVDPNGQIYVTGYTTSDDFPIMTSLNLQRSYERDAFITKFDSSLTEIQFSSYIGGTMSDTGKSVLVDPNGNMFISGVTESVDFPNWASPENSYSGNGTDGFVMKIDSSGERILFSFRFGGIGDDVVRCMMLDRDGNLLIAGWTNSNAFPSVERYGEERDGFLLKLVNLTDGDRDKVPDYWERIYGLDELANDSYDDPDLDGLSNIFEYQLGTFPDNNDSDSDLIPDGWEVSYGFNPLYNDSMDDSDNDSLTNREEYEFGTNPRTNDTDSDQMPDGWEVQHSLNATQDDAEDDLDFDGLSNLQEYIIGLDPTSPDSDGDHMPDGWEVDNGLNPLFADSDMDHDSDSLTNLEEYQYGTDPFSADTDNDGYSDLWEVTYGFNPTDPTISLMQQLMFYSPILIAVITPAVSLVVLLVLIRWNEERRIRLLNYEVVRDTKEALEELGS